jgi:hypothetical protein
MFKNNPNKQTTKRKWRSPAKQKVLALLMAGTAMGLTRNYNKQRWVLKQIPKELRNINRLYLYQILHEFHNDRLVDYHENKNGIITLVLSEKGKKRSLAMDLDAMEIKPPKTWDGKWRLVAFDVPEKKRNIRDAFRDKLKELGFYELHHSLFVFPYPCRDEIDFMVEVLDARPYVIYGEINNLSPDAKLRLHFKLF